MSKIIKAWAVYSLNDSVDGITNDGIFYSKYDYTLSIRSIHKSEQEAIADIERRLEDYKKRDINNERFVIMQTYFLENDSIFNYGT